MFISVAQQNDSVIQVYVYTLFLKIIFPIMVYHEILNIVLCAIVGPCCSLSFRFVICGSNGTYSQCLSQGIHMIFLSLPEWLAIGHGSFV